MSSNQISQTLFRFVSLRSPQLAEDNGKEKRFIFRPAAVAALSTNINVFDAAVQQGGGLSKWDQMLSVTEAFKSSSSFIDAVAVVENAVGNNLYSFSAWLSRNRDSFTQTELSVNASAVSAVLDVNVQARLWNNLFCQVLTQQSFYVKEALIQVLTAYHVLNNLTDPDDSDVVNKNRLVASAKVVLPKELFLDEAAATNGFASRPVADLPKDPEPLSAAMQKRMAVSEASYFSERYEKLLKEIRRIEKLYWSEYNDAYESEWNKYQSDVRVVWNQYESSQEQATLNWCATRNNTVPMDINDPCNQPPKLQAPVIAPFRFNFMPQTAYLENRLSPDSILLINLADDGYYYDVNNPGADPRQNSSSINTDGFEQIYANINIALQKNTDAAANNTYNPVARMASVGGVTVPVNRNETPTPAYANSGTFYLCSHVVSDYNQRFIFNMDLYVPDSTYGFQSIQYGIKPTPSGYPANTTHCTAWSETAGTGMVIHIDNLFNTQAYPFLASGLSNAETMVGTIYFTNGAAWSFEINLKSAYPYARCVWSKTTVVREPGNTGGGNGNPNPGSSAAVFKPSGFGVKQLGVADYRKVEQSVHCYVEGEVAHIENVMAREYREKATRRLRRNETTTSFSSESEREQLTDTTSTDRFEMQNEISTVLQESRDLSLNAHTSVDGKWVKFDAGANFATHNSKEQSIKAAVTQAKELTERAMDRVVSRVKRERVEKIIEEFEENNKHGFDNTKGDKHVVGVYRWVDKIYKNQIYNYGKRLMFEFMIPQPAKLHLLGMKQETNNVVKVLTKPVDPRTAQQSNLSSYQQVSPSTAAYWAGVYNAEIPKQPLESMSVAKSFSFVCPETSSKEWEESAANNADITLPPGYISTFVTATFNRPYEGHIDDDIKVVAGYRIPLRNGAQTAADGFVESFPVSFSSLGFHAGSINFKVDLALTNEARNAWKQEVFKAIIDAYEKALAKYEDELAQQQSAAAVTKETNPGFYRQIENTVLRKNCISYLVDQGTQAVHTYGRKMYKDAGSNSFKDYEVNLSPELDDYTSFARFLEQAFEWDIMSYYFYPFYWAEKNDWIGLYQYENDDPLFRSFMQSGLARVVVSVRPGFEDAVRFFMQTGLVWNGGEVPLIEDPLHLSIVDELRQPTGVPEGKAWATRIPTTLTILQADSIGLKVEKALPCNCDDVNADTWENPDKVPCGDSFVLSAHTLNGGNAGKQIQFSFIDMDADLTIGDLDGGNIFPREYTCMGQTITINRDAAWQPTDSIILVYEKLARELSYIPGVEAEQVTNAQGNPSGIRFTVDTDVISDFTFIKPLANEVYDKLRLQVDAAGVRVLSPSVYPDRIRDKANQALTEAEFNTALPISRFEL